MRRLRFIIKAIVLLLFVSVGCFKADDVRAQTDGLKDMQVVPMQAPSAIPVFRSYPDNGVLIIESTLANIRFSSSVDFEADLSEPEKGIYRYILKPYQQTITAVLSGYRMLRFSIPEVQPREAVYYSVNSTSSDKQEDSNVSVRFMIEPQSAVLYVNDEEQNHSQSIHLPQGNTSVRIVQPGMKTIRDNISVTPQNNFFSYKLENIEQEIVTITTNPPNPTIAIDDVEQGRNQFFLFPGKYSIRISKSNYGTISTTIDVTEGGNNTFSYNLKSNVARLLLDVSPSEAQIRVNNRTYRNDEDIILSPGQHLLTISKSGHEEYRERLTLEENEQLSRTINLTAITGGLLFGVTPSSAEVSLINSSGTIVESWTGLNKISDLPVGTYKVQATAEGFKPLEQEITIKADESSMFDVTMEEGGQTTESKLISIQGDIKISKTKNSGPLPVFRDFPGQAVLIIQSNLTNLTFESSTEIVADRSDPSGGIYRLIIHPTKQSVTVSSEGYKPTRFSLPYPEPREVLFYSATLDPSEKKDVNTATDDTSNDEVFIIVENQPQAIGAPSVQHAIYEHIVYPTVARRANIEGRVLIQFIVDTQGNVKNPTVIRGIGGGCDEAALNALKKVRFNPGTQRGKPVNVKLTIPVVFRLQ